MTTAARLGAMTDSADPGASEERSDAIRSLEAEFGELIARMRHLISENAQRLSPGLLPGGYKTFTTIVRRGGITLSALAEVLLADKGQMSRTVRDLEQRGLVQRTPDPEDGRSQLISATEFGLERLAAARAPQEGHLTAALDEWSVDDIRTFSRMLHALTAGVRP